MPNSWNFTFNCPTAMKIYLLVLFFPGQLNLDGCSKRIRILPFFRIDKLFGGLFLGRNFFLDLWRMFQLVKCLKLIYLLFIVEL